MPRPPDDQPEGPATQPGLHAGCAICGRELWSDGLPPELDSGRWICGDCDQARNAEALDLDHDQDL